MEPFFVVNPVSGAGRTARLWRSLGRGLPFATTRGPGHATDLTAEALERGAALIVVVGGDGTLNEALNGFFDGDRQRRPGSALAMLPSGTGRDLARTLGLEHVPPERQLRGLRSGRLVHLDCGIASFRTRSGSAVRRFLNVASAGFSALIAQRVNRGKKTKAIGGRLSFLWAVLRSLITLRNERMSVTVDGSPFYEGRVLLAAVANGRFFGGSMMIAPEAEPSDALLDLVLVTRLSRPELVRHIGKLYSGQHLQLPYVRHCRGRQISIRCADAEAPIELDGEQPGSLDATFKVQPASVPFLLPAL